MIWECYTNSSSTSIFNLQDVGAILSVQSLKRLLSILRTTTMLGKPGRSWGNKKFWCRQGKGKGDRFKTEMARLRCCLCSGQSYVSFSSLFILLPLLKNIPSYPQRHCEWLHSTVSTAVVCKIAGWRGFPRDGKYMHHDTRTIWQPSADGEWQQEMGTMGWCCRIDYCNYVFPILVS